MSKKVTSVLLCVIIVILSFSSTTFGYSSVPTRNSPSIQMNLETWRIAPGGEISQISRDAGLSIPEPVSDEAIAPGYDTGGWIEIAAPGTVLGGLLDAGVYDKLFVADNDGKKNVYFDDNYALVPRDDFAVPWWHSTNFTVPAEQVGKHVTLTIKGLSYTARIFINGKEIKNTNISIIDENEVKNRRGEGPVTGLNSNPLPPYTYEDLTTANGSLSTLSGSRGGVSSFDQYKNLFQGVFRTYELDVTDYLNPAGESNNIKIKVNRPYHGDNNGDFSFNWHDWHYAPADNDMGLTNEIFITTTGAASLANPLVTSVVAEDLSTASVSFYVDVNNLTNTVLTGVVEASVRDPENKVVKTFTSGGVTIKARAYCQEVAFPVQIFTGDDLQLWWPYLSGDQPLYHVDYTLKLDGAVSDALTHRFGIRQFSREVNKYNFDQRTYMLQIFVNHRPIVIRGGGYTPTDVSLRRKRADLESTIDLVKSMGMNTIRDEGKFWDNEILDILDEHGILFMDGYMCCDRFQNPNTWSKEERFVVYESTYAQIRTLRMHPCVLMFMNGSDRSVDCIANENQTMASRKMMEIEGRLRWYDHALLVPSANDISNSISTIAGAPGGMEMGHTYDTTGPAFYYASYTEAAGNANRSAISGGETTNGVCGFNSEGQGGAGIPVMETIMKMIPEANLWPINQGPAAETTGPGNYNTWGIHACRSSVFSKIDPFLTFTDNAFGGSVEFSEWIQRAQMYEYECQRAQYEALGIYRYVRANGIINWMLNGPRPTIMWNQFDFYFNPHGSTYGAGKANEPVHIMYNPVSKEINVVNNTFEDMGLMTATLQMYDINSNMISEKLTKQIDIVPDDIGERYGDVIDRITGFNPTVRDGDDWYESQFVPTYSSYATGATANTTSANATPSTGARIKDSAGVTKIWDKTDVAESLVRPTTDVYFMRLELKDKDGKVVSYNSYAVPRRQDSDAANLNNMRGRLAQAPDWTLLNALPAINPKVGMALTNVKSVKSDDFIVQTFDITNHSDVILYGVEFKSYMDETRKELCPAVYGDNLITLYPGETRTITIKHRAFYLDGDVVIAVNCYNNIIQNKPDYQGNLYLQHNIDPTLQVAGITSDTAPDVTTNLARGRAVTGGNNANATAISNGALLRANRGTNVVDSELNTFTQIDVGNSAVVNLGTVKVFDRIALRWASNGGSENMIAGVPDHVKVEISNDNEEWTTIVEDFDNTGSRSSMINIYLDKVCSAQYVRFTPTGLTGASTAYGRITNTTNMFSSNNGTEGTQARAARVNFTLSGIEIYRSYNYVFVDVKGNAGKVSVGGADLTAASTAMQRTLKVYAGESLELMLTPDNLSEKVNVFLNGVLVNGSMTGNSLSLANAGTNDELLVVFGDVSLEPMVVFDPEAARVTASLETKNCRLIAAVFDTKSGKLVGVEQVVDNAAAVGWRQVILESKELLGDLFDKYLNVYIWDSSTYIPITKKHTF